MNHRWKKVIAIAFALAVVALTERGVVAQEDPAEGNVQLDFGHEIELSGLVDYVSERLEINILYDEEINGKKVRLRAPAEVPTESLLQLLQSALQMKGLTLVDAEAPGWKRIVALGDLRAVAPTGDPEDILRQRGAGMAVTEIFTLHHADVQQLDQMIKPFLTKPGGNSIALQEVRTLIVTDFASNLIRIGELVELMDQPRPDVVVEFRAVDNMDASELATQINALLTAMATAEGENRRDEEGIHVSHYDRTNQIVIIGHRDKVDNVLNLIETLDVPLGLSTQVYSFRYVAAERIDRLVRNLIDPVAIDRTYRSTVDSDDNLLIATTTEEMHQQIEALRNSMDVETSSPQSPVQIYKLENAIAIEVLDTIRAIEGAAEIPDEGGEGRSFGRIRPRGDRTIPGPNLPPNPPGAEWPSPPAYRGETQEPGSTRNVVGPGGLIAPGRARITADLGSNSLIVVAEQEVQQVYGELIRQLDHRRPQVLIEATMVVLNTSDTFSLGVEISGGDGVGAKRLISFSSFGLSTVDPVTGALALIPGLGYNGTLVNPDVADVVLRALATHSRGRILSSPRILVNDNATGLLTSVEEVPFTSVNASQTVATTSFAGFAEAGTTITVTPHISNGDHLQLEYNIVLNSFTGTGSGGVPPPRQTDEIESTITIPDGHTVIVGGLNRTASSQDKTALPFLERFPLLEILGSSRTLSDSQSTLFVFIKPTILRDDKFEDLKFISDRDAPIAGIRSHYPQSGPLLVR